VTRTSRRIPSGIAPSRKINQDLPRISSRYNALQHVKTFSQVQLRCSARNIKHGSLNVDRIHPTRVSTHVRSLDTFNVLNQRNHVLRELRSFYELKFNFLVQFVTLSWFERDSKFRLWRWEINEQRKRGREEEMCPRASNYLRWTCVAGRIKRYGRIFEGKETRRFSCKNSMFHRSQ